MIFSLLKKILKKLIGIVIILLLIISFACAYLVGLVIIKPRDITPLFSYANQYLIKKDNNISVDGENAILQWNKKNLTFDLSLNNAYLKWANNEVKVPSLKIDISRKSLLLGKIKFDKIFIEEISYNLNVQENEEMMEVLATKKNKQSLYKKTNKIVQLISKKLLLFANIEINKIHLNLEQNEKILLKGFSYKILKKNKEIFIDAKVDIFDDNELVKLAFNCSYSNKKVLQKCAIKIENFTEKLHNNQNIKGIYDINASITNINKDYSISLKAKGKNSLFSHEGKKYHYNNSELLTDFNIKEEEFIIKKLSIILDDKTLNTNLTFKDKKLDIAIKATNVDENEMFVLWPEKAGKSARDWVKRSLLKVNVKTVEMDIGIKLQKPKPKITKLYGKYVFEKASLKVLKQFESMNNGSGTVLIEDNKLDIQLDKAFIADDKITNFRVYSPLLQKGKTQLFVEGKMNLKGNNFIKFLLAESLPQDKLKFFENYLQTAKINNELKLHLDLTKKPFTLKQFEMSLNAKATYLSEDFSKDSVTDIKITNNFQDEAFYVDLDFTNSAIDQKFILYKKSLGDPLKGKLSVAKRGPNLYFKDFDIFSDKSSINSTKIKGYLSFHKGKLTNLNFPTIKLNDNELSFSIDNKKSLIAKLIAKNLIINNFKKKTNKTAPKKKKNSDLKFTYEIDSLHFAEKDSDRALFNNNGTLICSKKLGCSQILIDGIFDKSYYAFSRKNEEILFETNNLGKLIYNLTGNNKIEKGNLKISGIEKDKIIFGDLEINNIFLLRNNLFHELSKLKSFRFLNGTSRLKFEKGNASFEFNLDNKAITLIEALIYGNKLGISSNGVIDFSKKNLNITGNIIPAYKINNLFGLNRLPIIKKIFPKEKGILSVNYNLEGEINNAKFKINPIKSILPGFIDKIL